MKLTDLLKPGYDAKAWEGYQLPKFDLEAVRAKTHDQPTWLHFGAGNIFRAFPAALLEDLLDQGAYDRGVIVAEGFDFEIIDKAYTPYDNLSLLVVLQSDGTIQKKVVAAVTESLKADPQFTADWARLEEIITAPSLQVVSFTITEKGYSVAPADLDQGLSPMLIMGKVAVLLYKRYQAGALPLTLQSMDNCSHNGDKVKAAVLAYAEAWRKAGLVDEGFLAYLNDASKVSFPWSMIDKITPRPDALVQEMLEKDGFEDRDTIITGKNTYTAPFVNAEETEYLVVEDCYTNGRPPLDKAGVLYTDQATVDKVERMKVCTCLNPLHTALAIYGCLLGCTLISAEMKDEDLRGLITKMGHIEAMPVVVDPGVLKPADFIDTVLNKRLPNPFMPDAPQRIATDTSQKVPIRFGETIKSYAKSDSLDVKELIFIPLAIAGWLRYLLGVDDRGEAMACSSDPMLEALQAQLGGVELGKPESVSGKLTAILSNPTIFGTDLTQVGLSDKIEKMLGELLAGPGAVRETLRKYVG